MYTKRYLNGDYCSLISVCGGVRAGLKSASIAAVVSVVSTIFIADLQYRLEDVVRHKVECLGDVESLKFIDNHHNNGLVTSTPQLVQEQMSVRL
ncbi:hypothetical protein Tco_0809191 [Tanacetum coccineum]